MKNESIIEESLNEKRNMRVRTASECEEDPDRGTHGQPLRSRRSVVDEAKERRALSRTLETQQRERMVERTFVLTPSTLHSVSRLNGAGEARATWIRAAIGKELESDARLEGKPRIRYGDAIFERSDELPRGRPGTHGEGPGEKLRIRLPIEMTDALDRIAERDTVSESVIVQKAIECESSRVRNAMKSTLTALNNGCVISDSRVTITMV